MNDTIFSFIIVVDIGDINISSHAMAKLWASMLVHKIHTELRIERVKKSASIHYEVDKQTALDKITNVFL